MVRERRKQLVTVHIARWAEISDENEGWVINRKVDEDTENDPENPAVPDDGNE